MTPPNTKTLTINGKRQTVQAPSVDELLTELGMRDAFVAVAVNHACVRRRDFAATAVTDGDEIEILAPMAGG